MIQIQQSEHVAMDIVNRAGVLSYDEDDSALVTPRIE
jgi:hypothetical protein